MRPTSKSLTQADAILDQMGMLWTDDRATTRMAIAEAIDETAARVTLLEAELQLSLERFERLATGHEGNFCVECNQYQHRHRDGCRIAARIQALKTLLQK